MDPEVAKRNAAAEERLRKLALPALREKSKTSLETNLERAKPRYDLIKTVAERHGIDPDELFLKYVSETRNEADPENPAVSSKGATGPFQVMPKVRAKFEDKSIKDKFEREADLAARHMADFQSRNKFESPEARAVVYNFGEGNFRDWGGQASKPLNDESTNYVAYSKYLGPRVEQHRAQRAQRAGEQAMVRAAKPPAQLEELSLAEHVKRRLTGELRTPEQYEAERAQFNQVTETARKAAAAAYRKEGK